MASVSLLASEQLTDRPSAPASTSCSMASACFWASSSLGVRQSIWMFRPSLALSSLAASMAPVRAAWKTGLPWDLATTPMVMARGAADASTTPARPAARRDRIFFMRVGGLKNGSARLGREPALGEPGVEGVEDDGGDDHGADDDLAVVLINTENDDDAAHHLDDERAE